MLTNTMRKLYLGDRPLHFHCLLGEEEGESIAALLFKAEDIAGFLTDPMTLQFIDEGFILIPHGFTDPLVFKGVDQAIINEMHARHVVLVIQGEDELRQFEVIKGQ